MRLVMVARYPVRGREPANGVEVAAVRLTTAFAAQGVEATVVAPGPADRHVRDAVQVIHTPEDSRFGLLTRLRTWRAGAGRELAALEPEIIHGQSLITCGIAVADDPRPVPKVLTVHGNVFQDVLAQSGGFGSAGRGRLVRNLAEQAVSAATVVVGVHPDRTLNVPGEPRRFVHIPNIVDDRFFDLSLQTTPGRVVYFGGSRRVKGWDVLARAWPSVAARVPEAALELVGWDSEEEPRVADGSAVEWRGRADGREVADAMARASVIVLPSRFELAPIALGEAWAAGVPVVAAAVGGLPSLATGGAVLVSGESPDALADAVSGVLTNRIDTSDLVTEGRRRAEAWRAGSVVAAHMALYRELLQA
jgi:glycosyltransferase involved in cell wall biosynthesis